MDSKERISIMNNVIRANNAILDKKIELIQIRNYMIPYINGLDFEKTLKIKTVNKTINNILTNKLIKKEKNILADITSLKKYIKIRLNLIIGVKKLNGNLIYRYYAETFTKNGKIYAYTNTIKKGNPITHFSSHDINQGFVELTELIIDYKNNTIINTIDYFFDIKSGILIPKRY
jgi:hypothetical protein